MKYGKVLIVEDNDSMRLGLSESLKRDGYIVSAFDNGPEALNDFRVNFQAAVILDLKMEPLDGIQILEEIKKINPKTEVLMISAYGSVEVAVKAMRLGAIDFITKPFSQEEFRIRIRKIFEKIDHNQKLETLIEQNRILNEEIFSEYEEMIGGSDAIKQVYALISHIADTESSVLIQGESGTGKELVARAIHKKSKRAECPFIKVNCGALNENLLESELFGHEKGAFTGAIKNRKGRFELAKTGTLFLDEIGDISMAMQVKLLRVIQEGEFERVGGETTIKTDARILCATNRELSKLIAAGKFREDLYYRLSVIPINLPPLRERKEDIPALVNNALKKAAAKNNQKIKTINEHAVELLINYSWPGNIRELENLIERLSVITQGDEIGAPIVSFQISKPLGITIGSANLPLDEAVFSFEKNLIIEAMRKADGVKNRAAKILGISTSALYYKLEKFGLL
jgi:two-component system, NtrC family, response regulator HydG